MPPSYVPAKVRVVDAPGVALTKATVLETEAPGAMLPKLWGNGVPMVQPNLALVSITLFAVTLPMCCTVTVEETSVLSARVRVLVTVSLTPPHGIVQVGSIGSASNSNLR